MANEKSANDKSTPPSPEAVLPRAAAPSSNTAPFPDCASAEEASPPAVLGEPQETPKKIEYRLCSLRLPLAVYREVAAHLRQIEGVETGLVPQTSQQFDYLQSQVGGLWIRYAEAAADHCQPQIETVLAYYGDRYGQWENLTTKV